MTKRSSDVDLAIAIGNIAYDKTISTEIDKQTGKANYVTSMVAKSSRPRAIKKARS